MIAPSCRRCLFHALRREELCKLKVRDFKHARRGVPHLKVSGKGEKARYLPLHPGTNELIHDYLEAAGHGEEHPTGFTGSCGRIQHSSAANLNGALFRPVKNNTTGRLDTALKIGAHALRATAATNALESMVSRLDARVFPHESYRAAPCTKIAGVTIGISPNGLRARRSASSNTIKSA